LLSLIIENAKPNDVFGFCQFGYFNWERVSQTNLSFKFEDLGMGRFPNLPRMEVLA